MAETFNPSLLRRVSQDEEALAAILPQSVTELIEITHDWNIPVGNGMKYMGRAALALVGRIPKLVEDGIVYDFADRKALRTPYKPGEIAFPDTTDRLKRLDEFSPEEFADWGRFIDGIDPAMDVSREAATIGLLKVALETGRTLSPISKYLANPGEEIYVDRAKAVLEALPLHLLDTLLPDYTPEEMAFVVGKDSSEEIETKLESVRAPFIG